MPEEKEIEESSIDANLTEPEKESRKVKVIPPVSELYEDWFLDYSSYVILERAVPALEDGLKPVQRRILHAMKETDDGRFNKVANVIGNTMQYHPHGDSSIYETIVNLGQRDLLLDTQGNWGDVITGDSAAAARYIETRLSKFALEVAFDEDITEWQLSYDGRKKEPVLLPMKFPLVLAQGAEGIAVGLSTKILPHNFIELIQASIAHLKGEDFDLYPDFPTYGMADFTNYNEGQRGGRVRVRSKIESIGKNMLAIRNVPFSVTTESLIESILKANDSGKIKIKQVIDNTARDVEILIELPKGVSPDVTIDALYAFTQCEISIAPNACVIFNERPVFLGVKEILRHSAERTKELLRKELEIKLADLFEKWHFSSLEKIFIEKRIYRKIEECETWEAVIEAIFKGLQPYIKHLKREVTKEDVIRLTEIKIKRISKYDSFRADELISAIEKEINQTVHDLAHLTEYAIRYFENLLAKYGKGRERRTEIRTFDTIEAKNVAVANRRLYVNRKEGFVGFGLKKEEPIGECSELDDIIVFRKDGKFIVVKVDDKVFVGKDIIHVDVFKKDDERMIYNVVYFDSETHWAMAKRFNVSSINRDKEYDITRKNAGSRIIYFTANPHGESEIVTVFLTQSCKARKKIFDFDFSQIAIKNRSAVGNIMTKYPVRKIIRKSVDTSTVIGIDVWYDEHVGKLNTREIGKYLGNFTPDDLILAAYDDGTYELTTFDMNNHYNYDKLVLIEQFVQDRVVSAVYFNPESNQYFAKRFLIETTTTGRLFKFISEAKDSRLVFISTGDKTIFTYDHYDKKKKEKYSEQIEISEFVEVMGWKAVGKKLRGQAIENVELKEIIYEEPPANGENGENEDAGVNFNSTEIEEEKTEAEAPVEEENHVQLAEEPITEIAFHTESEEKEVEIIIEPEEDVFEEKTEYEGPEIEIKIPRMAPGDQLKLF